MKKDDELLRAIQELTAELRMHRPSLVPAAEFAKAHNIGLQTVKDRIKLGIYAGVQIGRKWYLPK